MRKLLWLICSAWEIIYKNLIRARFLPGSEQRLLRVNYRKYKGENKILNGLMLAKGDLLAELHLSNMALTRYTEHKSPEWALYKDLIKELRLLSKQLKENPKPIKALTGITLLAPAAARLEFIIEEIPPGMWSSLNYIWLRLLRIAFSPKKDSDLKTLDTKRRPVNFWMSAEKFMEKF